MQAGAVRHARGPGSPQCDLTRVATFMLGNGRSDRVYDFLGLTSGHHTYSHHQHQAENHAALAKIDRWEMEQFSYLPQRMKSVRKGEETLLDNSLVYFGSEVPAGPHGLHAGYLRFRHRRDGQAVAAITSGCGGQQRRTRPPPSPPHPRM